MNSPLTRRLWNSRRALRALHQLFVRLALVSMAIAGNLKAQQTRSPSPVEVRGAGPETWVLLSGIVGGVAGMRKLAAELAAGGNRVVTIDAYALSIDSADVSFAALARRVDARLALLSVRHARVLGHAHGGGVALRLAASFPERVSSVELIDVGALPDNRTKTMGKSLALLPTVARIPGGRSYMRRKFVDGIRENSGDAAWFDDATQHAFVDVVLDDIDRVVAMAQRLSTAQEPEPLTSVMARVHVPVTVVIGGFPHASSPNATQLDALASLGNRLRVVRLTGVGHFVQQEAPEQLLLVINSRTAVASKTGDRQ